MRLRVSNYTLGIARVVSVFTFTLGRGEGRGGTIMMIRNPKEWCYCSGFYIIKRGIFLQTHESAFALHDLGAWLGGAEVRVLVPVLSLVPCGACHSQHCGG